MHLISDMVRPCFLVIDREFPGSISTRKLVIETAKFNVLTAYSAKESLETLKLFPNIHGIVLDADVRDIPCSVLIKELREIHPRIPIIVISGPDEKICDGADKQLESFDPKRLLGILQALEPEKAAEIEKQNERLNRQ
jgi:DNA-binding NtrC family response regulator